MAESGNAVDQSPEQTAVLDFTTIKVDLTYPGYPTWTLLLRRSLGHELRAVQKEYMGKKKAEQDALQQQYRVDFLSRLLREDPIGIPNYDTSGTVEDNFKGYFSSEELDDQVDHIWVAYQNKLYPKELTLSTSE